MFLPLIRQGYTESITLGRLKYFVSQTPPAIFILIGLLCNPRILYHLIPLAVFFKIGVPPFHGWVIRLRDVVNPLNIGILLNIIKFLPFIILSYFYPSSIIYFCSMFTFIFIVVLLRPAYFNIIILIILSSIGNSYWVMAGVYSNSFWLEYLIVYSSVSILMFLFINEYKLNIIKGILYIPNEVKLILVLFILNIGGVPPIIMFFLKVIIIKGLFLVFHLSIGLILLGGILIYFYINMRFNLYVRIIIPGKNIINNNLSLLIFILITPLPWRLLII